MEVKSEQTHTLAYARLLQEFPSVTPKSEIEAWALLREFDRGIEAYEQLESPTAVDDRWAGVCRFNLLEDIRAVELFYRAISRGCSEAQINLAHAMTYIERGDEVWDLLAEINLEQLDPYDKVLMLRVRSMYQEGNGNLTEALMDITNAWEIAAATDSAAPILPEVLSQLAVLESRVGYGHRALQHVEQALQTPSLKAKRTFLIVKIHVLTILGQFEAAEAVLREVELHSDQNDPHQPTIVIHKANIRWATKDIRSAIYLLQNAAASAESQALSFEEFVSHLNLSALFAYTRRNKQAFEHLEKAERLIGDRSDRINFRFREVLLRWMSGGYSTSAAVMELEALVDELSEMGALQEAGQVGLHVANLLWRMDSQTAFEHLEKVLNITVALGSSGFLAREWVLLPEFRMAVALTHPELAGLKKPVVGVVTIGTQAVNLNHNVVSFGTPRAAAILAYLLDSSEASIGDVLTAVFTDRPRHVARRELHLFLQTISETFSPRTSGRGRVQAKLSVPQEVEFIWDVQAIRDGKVALGTGEFLPGLDSPWINLIRTELQAIRAKAEKSASTL